MTSPATLPQEQEPPRQEARRRSSSRIIPRHRAPSATIPIWPATVAEDDLRASMVRASEAGDAGGALYYSELLLHCRPGDVEVHEMLLRSRVAIEEMFVEWLGGSTRRPRVVIEAALLPLLDLEPEEAALVDLIDGNATVQDLVCAVALPPLDVLRTLFALAHGGALSME
jgi:hypothetical protein